MPNLYFWHVVFFVPRCKDTIDFATMQENQQKISPIKQRILRFAEKLGISKREFYNKIGVSRGTLESKTGITEDVVAKFIAVYPEVNTEWLIRGEGDMLRGGDTEATKAQSDPSIDESVYPKGAIPISKVDMKALPLVPYEAAAGILKGGVEGVRLKDCEHVLVPFFTDADFLITISGDSMQPSFNSGDLAACKFTPAFDLFFQWGKPYIIATEEGILLKRIYNDEEKALVSFVSDNEKYPPIPFPREQIYQVARVLGVVRRD